MYFDGPEKAKQEGRRATGTSPNLLLYSLLMVVAAFIWSQYIKSP